MRGDLVGVDLRFKGGTQVSVEKRAGTDDVVVAYEMFCEAIEKCGKYKYSELSRIHDPDYSKHAAEAME